MASKRFLLAILISCGFIVSLSAQPLSSKIQKLIQGVNSLTYSNKYDSAQVLVLHYLSQEDLSDIEIFYGHYYFAEILKSAGKPGEMIKRFENSKNFLKKVARRKAYEALIEGKIGECYFDLMDFENAKKHALLSINANPDSSLRAGGHAVNYLIVGHSDYLENNYRSALDYYNHAKKEYLVYGEPCELPLVYTKMAQAHHGMQNAKLAVKLISKAILISDSCDIELYKLFSKRAMFDVYKESNNYKMALELILEINDLAQKLEHEKQAQLINELEVAYETKLMQIENENLKQINWKNEEILAKQKQALIISVIAIAVLLVLTVMLVRISIQRKKAELNLAILNARLEQKVAERTEHLRTANENIQENSALLAFQNKQLVDFCNIISHNLRGPLMNMSMLVDYIENSKDEAEQKQTIEKLKPVIGNLNETFDELLESLQVQQDLEIESEKIDLKDSLKRTLEGLEGEIDKSHAVIKTNFDDAALIYCPSKYLSSILHNLVSNAIKYRSPNRKPTIKLETKKSNGNIILSVQDNGLGIDLKKHGDNVFKIRKVFHEHPDARGFGLYITKTQVETMGGRIWLESNPDEGSTFFIEFKNQNI